MNQLHHLGYFPGVFYYYYWRHNLYATAITYKILIMVCHHYQYVFSSAFQKSRYLSINLILLILLYFYFGSFIRFPRLPWFIFIISTCFKGLTYYFFHLMLFFIALLLSAICKDFIYSPAQAHLWTNQNCIKLHFPYSFVAAKL